ncbi:MAG: type I 3-dehydroquinate dehydratase [Candidatus Methanoperedenaceae archaeon]|nr:MAG: type I 3-dehydroquinate dehydratase [Candidatus Methanoperedenaceae archaeon]
MSFPCNRSVVASIGKNPVNTSIKAKELGADILELRIDLISEDPQKILKDLKELGLPVIITNRMKKEGGAWTGSENLRIRELVSLIPYADAVDIELYAPDRDVVVKKAKNSGKKIIISTHNFENTPDVKTMAESIRDSFDAGADIAKLAVMPHSLNDVLHLLEVTLHSCGAVCTIAMGEIGKHSRAISPIYGSVMTYGYVDIPVAPGQLRVDELKYMLKLL